MIYFLIGLLIAGIIINIKGFQLKTTLLSVFVFISAFVLFYLLPITPEINVLLNRPVTEVDGKYEIELFVDTDRIEFSDPDIYLEKDGERVSSDLKAGRYTVVCNKEAELPTYSTYIKSDFIKTPLAILIAFVAAWICIVARYAIHLSTGKLFLLFIIPLALVYLFLFPENAVPDAHAHFYGAYRYSNLFLGFPEWAAREEDRIFIEHSEHYMNNIGGYYQFLKSNFHLMTPTQTMTELPRATHMAYYSPLNYLPQIIGFMVGRLLGLGTIPTIYLARILILAVYIVVIWRAIEKVPTGKHIFFLVALLPMSLNMSSSYSYDAMVIIASIAFIAAVLSESSIELIVWAFVLGGIKGGAFLLFLVLIFLIKNKWKKIVTVASAAFSLVLFDLIIPSGGLYQFGTDGNGYYTALFALQHPLSYVKMALRAYIQNLDGLVFGAGGSYLSWLMYAVPSVLIIAMLALGWIMAAHEKDEKPIASPAWIWRIPIFLSLVLTPIMLLSWTETGADTISGLQGRYFLPLFIPAFFLLSKRNLYCGENQTVLNKCYCILAMISGLGIWYITQMFLTAPPA